MRLLKDLKIYSLLDSLVGENFKTNCVLDRLDPKNCPESKFQIVLLDRLLPKKSHFKPSRPKNLGYLVFLLKIMATYRTRKLIFDRSLSI